MTSSGYADGTVLAGRLDGALAGHMDKQDMKLLHLQIGESLAAFDRGFRRDDAPNAIGWLEPFQGDFTLESQVERLRDGHAQLGTMIAAACRPCRLSAYQRTTETNGAAQTGPKLGRLASRPADRISDAHSLARARAAGR